MLKLKKRQIHNALKEADIFMKKMVLFLVESIVIQHIQSVGANSFYLFNKEARGMNNSLNEWSIRRYKVIVDALT